MNARATFGSVLASGAIISLGWTLGTAGQTAATAPEITAPSTNGTSVGSGSGNAGAPTDSSTGSSTVSAGTYTGRSVSTRFGDVQVQITVADGQITAITPLQLTDRDRRSMQISNQAAPILRDEVLSAQSANVRMVAGATYTSEGYLTSIQSAIDQAGL